MIKPTPDAPQSDDAGQGLSQQETHRRLSVLLHERAMNYHLQCICKVMTSFELDLGLASETPFFS